MLAATDEWTRGKARDSGAIGGAELVVRFWTPDHIQLATMQTSVWYAQQSPPPWLDEPMKEAEALELPPEVPWSELAGGVELAELLELADGDDVVSGRARTSMACWLGRAEEE